MKPLNINDKENDRVRCHFRVSSHLEGLRADQYLQRKIGRISRSRAQRIIEAGDFLLESRKVKSSVRVKSGQEVTLIRFAPDKAEDVDDFLVQIIFENAHLLVVNKPPGLSIHPSANCLYRTLTHWLRRHYPKEKINPCHRLDKETSGLVICAKTRCAERAIKKSFALGLVFKTYLAVASGIIENERLINVPLDLQRNRGLVAIRMIEDPFGKPASTRIRPLRVNHQDNRTLLLVKPITGRQHQIRAHLSIIGHPLVGDKLYGLGDEFFDRLSRGEQSSKNLPHSRHALHAARIRFKFNDERYLFRSPLPFDMQSLMKSGPNSV